MTKESKQKLFTEIVEYLKTKGATKVAVFGSYVRNEENTNSDIDVLVDFPIGSLSLLDLAGYELELSEKIGIKVDLGTVIDPYIEKYVKDEMVYLLR